MAPHRHAPAGRRQVAQAKEVRVTGGGFPEPVVLIQTAAEAGRVRQVVHPLRLNRRGAVGFLIAWLCLPVIVFAVAAAGHAGAIVPVLCTLLAVGLALAIPLAMIIGTRIRLCEHGLIVSSPAGRRTRFFIPYTTIDPASAMVHPVPRRGGAYRYKALTALNDTYPWPGMSEFILATCPVMPRLALAGAPYGQPLNIWGAPYSRHGISFRALHPVFASPWWRGRPAVRGHPPRAQWVLGAMRRLLGQPDLIPVVIRGDQPMMRWMFGTDQPERLLRAIEEAMVADRVPGADGFAARALARPYDLPPKDIPADPALW